MGSKVTKWLSRMLENRATCSVRFNLHPLNIMVDTVAMSTVPQPVLKLHSTACPELNPTVLPSVHVWNWRYALLTFILAYIHMKLLGSSFQF